MRPGDVRGLVAIDLAREVGADASERGGLGWGRERTLVHPPGEQNRADEPAGGALDVALDARELAGDEHALMTAKLHGLVEELGRIQERVAVHRAEPQKFCA